MPASATVCGLPDALSTIESPPVSAPTTLGVKLTATAQVPPAASVDPQLVTSLKFPTAVIDVMVSASSPVFVTYTRVGGVVVPTVCDRKVTPAGNTAIPARGAATRTGDTMLAPANTTRPTTPENANAQTARAAARRLPGRRKANHSAANATAHASAVGFQRNSPDPAGGPKGSRNIGGTIGVSVLGAILSHQLPVKIQSSIAALNLPPQALAAIPSGGSPQAIFDSARIAATRAQLPHKVGANR